MNLTRKYFEKMGATGGRTKWAKITDKKERSEIMKKVASFRKKRELPTAPLET